MIILAKNDETYRRKHAPHPPTQVPSIQGLSRGLGEDFKLVHVERVPCMRPLTDRTFEYASAEATVWRRD